MSLITKHASYEINQRYSEYSTIFMTVGCIYVNVPHQNQWNKYHEGYLQLAVRKKTKIIFINLYDMKSYELIFQHELFYGFANFYRVIDRQFHFFQSDICEIGISFASKKDGNDFYYQIMNISPKKQFLSIFKKADEQFIITEPNSCEHISGVAQNDDGNRCITGDVNGSNELDNYLQSIGYSRDHISNPNSENMVISGLIRFTESK